MGGLFNNHKKQVVEDEEQVKTKKVNLFSFINDIGHEKNYIFNDDTKSVYNMFMVNRAFMQNMDTILLANELNKCPTITKLMHHDYLFYSVDAKKRFNKWAKKSVLDKPELVEYIMKRYTLNESMAISYIEMMDDETILNLETNIKNKGGRK